MSNSDGTGTPKFLDEFFARKINKRRRKLDSYEDEEGEGEKSPKISRPIKKKKSSTSRFRRTQNFNETSTKVLDKDSKIARYVLFKWVFKLTLREFSVTVEGFKKDEFNLNPAKHWNSTKIVQIFSPTELKTESGSLYVLDGPIDSEMAKIYGYPEWLIKKFRKGFPSDWREILSRFYENARETGQLSSSFMENLLSESPKNLDDSLFKIKNDLANQVSSPCNVNKFGNSTPQFKNLEHPTMMELENIGNKSNDERLKDNFVHVSQNSLEKPPKVTVKSKNPSVFGFAGPSNCAQNGSICRTVKSPPVGMPEHRIIRDKHGTALVYYDDENVPVVTCLADPTVVLETLHSPNEEILKTTGKDVKLTKISPHEVCRPKNPRWNTLNANLESTNGKTKNKFWSINDTNLLKKAIEEKWPKGVKEWEKISNSLSVKRSVAACMNYARKISKDLKFERIISPKVDVEKSEENKQIPEVAKITSKRRKTKFPTLKERRQQKNALKLAVVGSADDADFFGETNAQRFNFKILNVLPDDLSTAATPQSIAGASRFGDFDSEFSSPTLDVTTGGASNSLLRSKTVQYVHQIQRNKPKKIITAPRRPVNDKRSNNKNCAGKVVSILNNVDAAMKERRKLNIANDDEESVIDDYFEPENE